MSENPIEKYLTDIAEVHGTRAHAPEISFYPALENLLTGLGKFLSPRVRCVIHIANRGAGLPDGGLFTADQFSRHARDDDRDNPFLSQTPSRGVIEAKSPSEDVGRIAESAQVERYWMRYGMVLVTNFRAFALVGRDAGGQPRILESFALADSADDFWRMALHARKTTSEQGERMREFLRRVLLHNAPLAEPRDVATILASYAHDALLQIERADLPALASLRHALEEALGLRFEGDKGEHFFRSTLVQTLFYGVFSAWVLWARRRAAAAPEKTLFADALRETSAPYQVAGPFDWRLTQFLLRVPMLRALFMQAANPDQLGRLGLIAILDRAAAALDRVDCAAFFQSFDEGHAVQYFYEPFLQAFDPELRKALGVWYTPEEIVRYQVERVDTVLREELEITDGLADPRVIVLDPCCGTGAYLRAVLRRIAATLQDKGDDALIAHDLKRAAMERVFGFEILPAPLVIAHLQIGLELETLGAPLSDQIAAADAGSRRGSKRPDPVFASAERVGVYLTNALNGWEPPKEPKAQLLFPEMEEERDAAEKVKHKERILVILGNPPYNGYAGVAVDEERDLSNAYRTTERAPAPQGQGLNDLYIRFFRMAERRIIEMNRSAQGVICFISNYSWLDGLSFTGMRERYLDRFDRIWIDCLNGDKYKTGKLTPDGQSDPSVFSTESNPEGIQVGTAIGLFVRKQKHQSRNEIAFRHLWGKTKRAQLSEGPGKYYQTKPVLGMGLSFMPGKVASAYFGWPLLPELFPISFPGVKTSRDDVVVDIDRDRLIQRMEDYFNLKLSHEEIHRRAPQAMTDTSTFKAGQTREILLKRGFKPEYVVRYCYRPLDVRWIYWEPEGDLLDRKREDYFRHLGEDNLFLFTTGRTRKTLIEPALPVRLLSDLNCMDSGARGFPLNLFAGAGSLLEPSGRKPNLSGGAAAYLVKLKASPEDLFYHSLAMLHAPVYRAENAGALRQDWPRVALPDSHRALQESGALGRQIAALLDMDTPVPGVTTGKIRQDLKDIAVFKHLDGKPARPEAGDLDLTAGWGHAGQGGVTMPGKGRIITCGENAFDVWLNEVSCWRNIPEPVWEYTIGGYQVIKKWLSYREKELLGRGLTPEEVRYVTEMARRLAALIALQPSLDENYQRVIKATFQWPIDSEWVT